MQRAYIVPPTLVKPLHKIIARAAITSRPLKLRSSERALPDDSQQRIRIG
jgi:hypothetical protein